MASTYHSSENAIKQLNEAQFFALLRREWSPGQHIGIAAPSGWGKTWLLARIMALRTWSAVYAMKQEDDSIKQFKGFTILDSFRDRLYSQRHVIVWPDTRDMIPELAEYQNLKEGRILLDTVFRERHWNLAIDDLNDACAIGLKGKLASMLRLCRAQKTSIVANYQRPFGIIQEILSQSNWSIASYHKDKRDIVRLAEANGLAPDQALAVNRQLERFDFLVFRPMEEPIIVKRRGT